MRRSAIAFALALVAVTVPLSAPAQRAAPKPLLNVAPDGVSLVDPATGRSRNLTFGTPRAPVIIATGRALGKAVSVGNSAECGAGPLAFVVYRGGLTLNFQGGRFVGWFLRKGQPKITNAAGIGIGSTRAQLAAVLNARIVPSTLGTEFVAGDLSGLLSGRARTARVTDLWAGATCIAR